MKERLEIGHGGLGGKQGYTPLAELLELMPSRAKKSSWVFGPFSNEGESWLEIVVERDGPHPLEAIAGPQERLSFTKLSVIAAETGQIIWGVFSAYDGGDGDQPWMRLFAFDGGWEIETADEKVKRRIERSFPGVGRMPA